MKADGKKKKQACATGLLNSRQLFTLSYRFWISHSHHETSWLV